jgi:hypothetical protein
LPKRRIGGLLIIVGVLVTLASAVVVIAGGTARITIGAPLYLLSAACLGLLGAGVALLSIDGPIFDGTLARRGLKTLAFGLVGDAVLFGMFALPGLQGSSAMLLFIPFFAIGWATVIGAGLTVLALLVSEGRPRIVGDIFLVVPMAVVVTNAFTNTLSGTDMTRLLAIAFGVVAAGALMLGFVGLALLAIAGPIDSRGPMKKATETTR